MSHLLGLLLADRSPPQLGPLNRHVPECLLSVGGRPLVDYWLDTLASAGARDAVTLSRGPASALDSFVSAHRRRAAGVRLTGSVSQDPCERVGVCAALSGNGATPDRVPDQALVAFTSAFVLFDLPALLAAHRRSPAPATALLVPPGDDAPETALRMNASGWLEPAAATTGEGFRDAGVYVLDADLFREVCAWDEREFLPDPVRTLAGRLAGHVQNVSHVPLRSYADYERANLECREPLRARGQRPDGSRRAVFLDRDGTLIQSVHYLSRPEQVELVPDCAGALSRLRKAGLVPVVVTNQAAVGKGIITEAELDGIHARMLDLMALEGVSVDGIYHCPVVRAAS